MTAAIKGVDDFFAAGGTLEQLRAHISTAPPVVEVADDTFSDARLAETIVDEVLVERFRWAPGLGWMVWNGIRWTEGTEVEPI